MMSRKPLLAFFILLLFKPACAQDGFRTETSSGSPDRTRIAVANFKPGTQNDPLAHTFDTTLYADLAAAGIFDIVSKSIAPPLMPGAPNEITLSQWSAPPAAAAMVAFGSVSEAAGKLNVNGFLFDAKNPQYPQVLAKQYSEGTSDDAARQIAHRFADEIILRLGGGVNGIAETKIYYIHSAGGSKEVWEMDYDGANQHAVTHLGTIALSPRVSPDNSRLAFAALTPQGFQIKMYSLLLGRLVAFPAAEGTNSSPAWAPDGRSLAFSSSRTGDPEIWSTDAAGSLARRLTSFRGPDASPVYNPRTGGQIAWISGRTGLPQLYTMSSDGSGVQRLTDGGYVSSPSWSPNGQFLAFAWNRKYGPGAPGGQDIYIMEIASKRWIQLTHDSGQCDFPTWSPDGRHLAFANSRKIWTMLADGSGRHPLSPAGADMPNWSWK